MEKEYKILQITIVYHYFMYSLLAVFIKLLYSCYFQVVYLSIKSNEQKLPS